MSMIKFSDDFKRDAVAQITQRGYRVAAVSEQLGVSAHSLYSWKRNFSKAASGDTGKDVEIRRLKREFIHLPARRVTIKEFSCSLTSSAPPQIPAPTGGRSHDSP